jgi:hypothetical protein
MLNIEQSRRRYNLRLKRMEEVLLRRLQTQMMSHWLLISVQGHKRQMRRRRLRFPLLIHSQDSECRRRRQMQQQSSR